MYKNIIYIVYTGNFSEGQLGMIASRLDEVNCNIHEICV